MSVLAFEDSAVLEPESTARNIPSPSMACDMQMSESDEDVSTKALEHGSAAPSVLCGCNTSPATNRHWDVRSEFLRASEPQCSAECIFDALIARANALQLYGVHATGCTAERQALGDLEGSHVEALRGTKSAVLALLGKASCIAREAQNAIVAACDETDTTAREYEQACAHACIYLGIEPKELQAIFVPSTAYAALEPDFESRTNLCPGSLPSASRGLKTPAVASAEDVATAHFELCAGTQTAGGLSSAGTLAHMLQAPDDCKLLDVVSVKDARVREVLAHSAECEAGLKNVAETAFQLIDAAIDLLQPMRNCQLYEQLALEAAGARTVFLAVSQNNRPQLYSLLSEYLPFAAPQEVLHLAAVELCEHTVAGSLLQDAQHVCAVVGAWVISAVAEAARSMQGLVKVCNMAAEGGHASTLRAFKDVHTAINTILSTFQTSPSRFSLLGYLPVDAPRELDAMRYNAARESAYLHGHVFPSVPLFSAEAQAVDAALGTASPAALHTRALLTTALAALPRGWGKLLGASTRVLSRGVPLYALYSRSAEVSLLRAQQPQQPVWDFSRCLSHAWETDLLFGMRVARVVIGSTTTVHSMPASDARIAVWGNVCDLAAFEQTKRVAQAVFASGTIPTIVPASYRGLPAHSPSAFAGVVSPYHLASVETALEDERVHADGHASAFCIVADFGRVVRSLGSVYALAHSDIDDCEHHGVLNVAAFTFPDGLAVFHAASVFAQADSPPTLASMAELIGPLASLLIARFSIAAFVSTCFAPCFDGPDLRLATHLSEQVADKLQARLTPHAASEILCSAFGSAVEDTLFTPVMTASPSQPFVANTLLAVASVAGLFLSSEDEFVLTCKRTVPAATLLSLDEIMAEAGARLLCVSARVPHNSGKSRWAQLWANQATFQPWVQPLLHEEPPQPEHYRAALNSKRESAFSADAAPVHLPEGHRTGWSAQMLATFLRSLGARSSWQMLAESRAPPDSETYVYLDAGESRDALTSIWLAILQHEVMRAHDDGTFYICENTTPTSCTKCPSVFGCLLHTSECIKGLWTLLMYSQLVVTFPHARVDYDQPASTEFTFPFVLEKAQAFAFFSRVYGIHTRDLCVPSELHSLLPEVCGTRGELVRVGATYTHFTHLRAFTDVRQLSVGCTCALQSSIGGLVDARARAWSSHCLVHPESFHFERVLQACLSAATLMRTGTHTLATKSAYNVLFAVWHADVFPADTSTSDVLAERIRISVDHELVSCRGVCDCADDTACSRQTKRLQGFVSIVELWARSLDEEQSRTFVRLCTGQVALSPKMHITMHVVAAADATLESGSMRDQQVVYHTCFASVDVPYPVVAALWEHVSPEFSVQELSAAVTRAFMT